MKELKEINAEGCPVGEFESLKLHRDCAPHLRLDTAIHWCIETWTGLRS